MRHRLPTLVLALATGTLPACGGDSQGPTPTASIEINPPSLTLDPGQSGRFTAEARRADGSPIAGAVISWSSSASHIASVAADGAVTARAGGVATMTALSNGVTRAAVVTVRDLYDLDARGVPSIVTADYIDLASIERISRFRSGIGHDYSDDEEDCRSMKHYFMPRASVDWSSVPIAAPAAGTIVDIFNETTFGAQIQIVPAAVPAATIILFHVSPEASVRAGITVVAGERLGRHVGSQTMSDVAIRIRTPTGTRLVSYFDAMTDGVFAGYQARGATSRMSLVLSRAERDASPLVCSGEQFVSPGSLANWFVLH